MQALHFTGLEWLFETLKYLYIDYCAQASKSLFNEILSRSLNRLEVLIIDEWCPDPEKLEANPNHLQELEGKPIVPYRMSGAKYSDVPLKVVA